MSVQQINSIITNVSAKSVRDSKSITSFKDTLNETVMNHDEKKSISNVSSETSKTTLSKEDLNELKQFLETNDLSLVDDGLSLIEKMLLDPNANLEQMIAEFLGLSEQDLKELMESMFGIQGLTLEQLLQSSDKLKLELSSEDSVNLIKAVKLYDLLLANKNLQSNNEENKFIQAALDKVHSMLQAQKESRASYLNQTFSNLLTDLSQETRQDNILMQPVQLNWTTNQQNGSSTQTKTSVDQLIQQFESILSKGNLTTMGGTQKMLIKLYPENLGSLRIELIQKDNGLIARLLTSSSQAKDLLESQLNVLRQAFSMQNIQIDKLEINQSFMEQQKFINKDGSQGGESNQQKSNQDDETETSFALNLEELLKEDIII